MAQRFLQTAFWADFKAAHGWKAQYFALDKQNKTLTVIENDTNERSLNTNEHSLVISVLTRSFSIAKIKRFSLAYIPMIPEAALEETKESLAEKMLNLSALLKPYLPDDCLFIRFDPAVDFFTPQERDAFASSLDTWARKNAYNLHRAPVAVQPPDTTILDLSKSEDDLLAGMKNKWRYNVRLASKKGVKITRHFGSDKDFENAFDTFYALFQQTSERDGVSFHEKEYYLDLLKRGCPESVVSTGSTTADAGSTTAAPAGKPLVTLYLAEHEGDYLAGIITLFCEREAVYLYGASGNIKRNLMPAYLLQWTAIQDAKAFGCPCYDFYGMPPTSDESHPMHGLYLFKTGFGGQNTHRPGSFDVPLKNGYKTYLAAEKLRAWWHRSFLKQIRGR